MWLVDLHTYFVMTGDFIFQQYAKKNWNSLRKPAKISIFIVFDGLDI